GQAALLILGLIAGPRLPSWLEPEMVLPAGCLLGALVSLGVLLLITRFTDDLLVVLLTGFLLSSLFLSAGSFLITLAQGYWELGRAVVAFTLGGVGGSGLRQVLLVVPLTIAGTIAAWCWARPLDLLLTGEEEAQSLGVDVGQVRHWSVIWVA